MVESKELFARIKARDIMQVVLDKGGKPSQGTKGESNWCGWREGHWRRQPHGVRWELNNPDQEVYEFDDGRRYHMKMIAPIFVNRAKFLGEESFNE